MNRRYMPVASAVLLTLASGCASGAGGGGGSGQMQNTVYATHRLVQNLDRNLSASVNQLNETTADLVARVNASDAENRGLRSLAEENQIRLEALQRTLDDLAAVLYRELELSPPAQAGRSAPERPDTSFDVRPGGQVQVQPAPRQEPPEPTEQPVVATPPPESSSEAALAHYKRAQQLYTNDEFALALEHFDSYLNLYPNTENAGNAQFWKAHCHLRMEEFEPAISQYQIMVRDYPSNGKVPSALNNQGVAYSRLDQNANARALFQQTLSDFPNDAAAEFARENLRKMEGND